MRKRYVKKANFVEYNSGLGNQLFQFNYSFFLKNECKKNAQMLRRETSSRTDRPFDLDEFLSYESTFPDPQIVGFQELLGRRLGKLPLLRKINLLRHDQINWIPESKEFAFSSPPASVQGGMNIFTGYFQNSLYVEDAFESYSTPLNRFIEKKYDEAKSKLRGIDGKAVLHIRRGDLLKPECSGMGLLNAKYYFEASSKLKINLANACILTDDKLNSLPVAKELGVTEVYGPDQLSTWETLAIFSLTPKLVSANSTLSWWGAYIGRERGNQAAFPSVWFENWTPDPKDSLHIKGQIMQESYFEKGARVHVET